MKMGDVRHPDRRLRHRSVGLGILIVALAGAAAFRLDFFVGPTTFRFVADSTKRLLLEALVRERPLPPHVASGPPEPPAFAYILGGSEDSLGYKFRTAGRLYRAASVGKILVLHSPGITEYSPALGRNLTNDEWTVMELGEEGVAAGDVEIVSVPASFFGTFAEARSVSRLARSRRIRHLVLITSPHHTERAWQAFSRFAGDGLSLYTCVSAEKAGIVELLAESVKLFIYRHLLLPLDSISGETVPASPGAPTFGGTGPRLDLLCIRALLFVERWLPRPPIAFESRIFR